MRIQAELLLKWYALKGRKLPWRENPDPYAVWVSEVMLQQTRVDTVLSYYEKWMQRFPSIADLAEATENEVLLLWEGLGYYSRARNLFRAARIVTKEYNGQLPRNVHELVLLPGIGRYTAGAISSIAFSVDEPAVDSNVRRVVSRVYDINVCVDSTGGEKLLWAILSRELPKGRAGDFNQALMDLGASICLPRDPNCSICPLIKDCMAKAAGIQNERPVLMKRTMQPIYNYLAVVVRYKDKILLLKRPAKGLLGGLWEFPNERDYGEFYDQESKIKKSIIEKMNINLNNFSHSGVYKHTYTHFHQVMNVYYCKTSSPVVNSNEYRWVTLDELINFPMGKIFRMISKSLLENEEY